MKRKNTQVEKEGREKENAKCPTNKKKTFLPEQIGNIAE